jgi:hypothetical protein
MTLCILQTPTWLFKWEPGYAIFIENQVWCKMSSLNQRDECLFMAEMPNAPNNGCVICPRRSELFGEHTEWALLTWSPPPPSPPHQLQANISRRRGIPLSLYMMCSAAGKSGWLCRPVRESTNRGAPRESIFKQYWKWFIYSPHKRSTSALAPSAATVENFSVTQIVCQSRFCVCDAASEWLMVNKGSFRVHLSLKKNFPPAKCFLTTEREILWLSLAHSATR